MQDQERCIYHRVRIGKGSTAVYFSVVGNVYISVGVIFFLMRHKSHAEKTGGAYIKKKQNMVYGELLL